jgi:hypothetical protein
MHFTVSNSIKRAATVYVATCVDLGEDPLSRSVNSDSTGLEPWHLLEERPHTYGFCSSLPQRTAVGSIAAPKNPSKPKPNGMPADRGKCVLATLSMDTVLRELARRNFGSHCAEAKSG